MSTTAAEYNAKVIDEYRGHKGRVGGIWEGTPLRLLHHAGAKSGANRLNPVGHLADESRYLIFASNGAEPGNPAWYHNLRAKPRSEIEVGRKTIDVVAAEATGEEHERLFRRGTDPFPDLAEPAQRTGRDIPVIVLTPIADA